MYIDTTAFPQENIEINYSNSRLRTSTIELKCDRYLFHNVHEKYVNF